MSPSPQVVTVGSTRQTFSRCNQGEISGDLKSRNHLVNIEAQGIKCANFGPQTALENGPIGPIGLNSDQKRPIGPNSDTYDGSPR